MALYKCAGIQLGFCIHEAPARWYGRCPRCGTLREPRKYGGAIDGKKSFSAASLLEKPQKPRFLTGIRAFDEVVGKPPGLEEGTTYLLFGPPGVGKSTLLLTVADAVAAKKPVLYAHSEGPAMKIANIARRMGLKNAENIQIRGIESQADEVETMLEIVSDLECGLFVMDSIAMANLESSKAQVGSDEMLKSVALVLTEFAGQAKFPLAVAVVCHINKEGQAAGPIVVEHAVDVMLELDNYLVFDDDGDVDEEASKGLVELRVGKTRCGPSGVSELFEMGEDGIKSVTKKRKSKLYSV